MIQACSSVAGDGISRGRVGSIACASRDGASSPAIAKAATRATTSAARRARGSRRARPGRGTPIRSRRTEFTARVTCACQSATDAVSGPLAPRDGRSVSTDNGRWGRSDASSRRRSAALSSGAARPWTPRTSSPRISKTVAASRPICNQGGSRRGRSSSAAHTNSPATPRAGHRAGQMRSNRMARRASARRPASRRSRRSRSPPGALI